MKKTTLLILALSLFTGIFFSCNKKTAAEKAFKPRLATDTKCQINIAGNYKNFEALEAEFDRFNEFYPDVELSFSFLDSYNKIGTGRRLCSRYLHDLSVDAGQTRVQGAFCVCPGYVR